MVPPLNGHQVPLGRSSRQCFSSKPGQMLGPWDTHEDKQAKSCGKQHFTPSCCQCPGLSLSLAERKAGPAGCLEIAIPSVWEAHPIETVFSADWLRGSDTLHQDSHRGTRSWQWPSGYIDRDKSVLSCTLGPCCSKYLM